MARWRSKIILSLVVLATQASADSYNERFPQLPRVLKEYFGALETPAGSSNAEAAEALMEKLYASFKFQFAIQRKTLLSVPSDPYRKVKPKNRIVQFGVAKLTGGRLARLDRYANYWWQLRLDQPRTPEFQPLGMGKNALVVVRSYPKKLFPPTISTVGAWGSFGHASMGLIRLGGAPDNDVFLNPGSNIPADYKRGIIKSIVGDRSYNNGEGIHNHIEISNFWDWVETQRDVNHLDVEVRVLRMSALQEAVIKVFTKVAHNLDYGIFTMTVNNCSHGTRDFLNSMLPLDGELDMTNFGLNPFADLNEALPNVTPPKVMRAASASYAEVFRFRILAEKPPKGFKQIPGFPLHDYEAQTTVSYQSYLRELHRWLSGR